MTVAQLRQVITPKEVGYWIEFFLWEDQRNTKTDYYLAMVAAETRRSWVKEPKNVHIDEFLITSKTKHVERKDKIKNSKSAWLLAAGIGKPKKKQKSNV